MNRLLILAACLGLVGCQAAYAASANWVGAYVNETNGQTLPLALEGRLQGMTNQTAAAYSLAATAYSTATGASATASTAYSTATNALAIANAAAWASNNIGGTGWTNLSITGTGNAITGATAAGTTLTLERGTIEGGGTGGTSTNEVRAIRNEAFRPYTTLGLSGGTALVTRTSGQWVMIEADDGAVTLDVDVAAYTNSLEAIRHQICWVRGTNETYAIVTNNIDNTLFVDLPASTTNHLFLERRPGWPRFQIWQDFR